LTAAVIGTDRWYYRSLGSTLSAVYLAAGRIAAYVELWGTDIHIAAGSLLITEAGGVLSDFEGHPWTIRSDWLVARGNLKLHHDLLALIRATDSRGDAVP
jgi:fructose-1,6-bisphosphatase/inositol monophosphatase family enzyme